MANWRPVFLWSAFHTSPNWLWVAKSKLERARTEKPSFLVCVAENWDVTAVQASRCQMNAHSRLGGGVPFANALNKLELVNGIDSGRIGHPGR